MVARTAAAGQFEAGNGLNREAANGPDRAPPRLQRVASGHSTVQVAPSSGVLSSCAPV